MTPRQKQALDFIKKFWQDNGYAPSYEEMKEGLGMKSKSSVAAVIDRLEERGFIVRVPNLARSIRPKEPVKKGKGKAQDADIPWA